MKNLCKFSLFIFLFTGHIALAQSYKTAGGIRFDNGMQITVKQHIVKNWTAEGILHTSLGSPDLGFSLLAEKHHKILFRGLNFYTGAGIHYYSQNELKRSENEVADNVFGLSLIGGAEISLGRINLSIDWKPEIHLSNTVDAFDWNGASLSVRYIFAKRERKTIKDWKVWDKFGRRNK